MKTLEQSLFEAKKRQEEIQKKTKKLGILQSGNVKTSFARNSKEFLLGMGFYQKGESARPTKNVLIEKRLKKDIVEIDVKKKQ